MIVAHSPAMIGREFVSISHAKWSRLGSPNPSQGPPIAPGICAFWGAA